MVCNALLMLLWPRLVAFTWNLPGSHPYLVWSAHVVRYVTRCVLFDIYAAMNVLHMTYTNCLICWDDLLCVLLAQV